MDNVVYSSNQHHLGDLWGYIDHLLKMSEKEDRIIYTSNYSTFNVYIEDVLEDILDLFDSKGRVEIVQKPDKTFPLAHLLGRKYLPAKIRWTAGPYKKICYQLDGISNKETKNPPADDMNSLLSFVNEFEFVKLGKPLTLKQSSEIAAKSDLFFGICSGMSHLCQSIGTPSFLIQYGMDIGSRHKDHTYTRCFGTADFITKASGFLESINE